MARRYGQRPSAILGLADEWAAYQLDAVALTLGRWVEGKLSERTKDGRPVHRLATLLGLADPAVQAGQFRSLRGMGLKKVKIPSSGVW